MAKTVVGLFDTFAEAQNVVQALSDRGFPNEDISLIANDSRGEFAQYGHTDARQVGDTRTTDDATAESAGAGAVGGTVVGGVLGLLVGTGLLVIPGIGPVLAAGPLATALGATALGAGLGAAAGGLVGALVGSGVPEDEANYYAEGVRRGGTLVTVRADDHRANEVYDIMRHSGAIDVQERGTTWRNEGWSRFDPDAGPYTAADSGVRPFSTTDQHPRPVDRDRTSPDPMDRSVPTGPYHGTGREAGIDRKDWEESSKAGTAGGTLAGAATGAAIGAAGGPVGAVIGGAAGAVTGAGVGAAGDAAGQAADEMDQHKSYTEEPAGKWDRRASGFDDFDSDFRNHYQTNFASGGYAYDRYLPVYRYGYNLGTDTRFRDRDWSAVEPEARRTWEQHNPGTWEQFKEGVRHAWERARGRR